VPVSVSPPGVDDRDDDDDDDDLYEIWDAYDARMDRTAAGSQSLDVTAREFSPRLRSSSDSLRVLTGSPSPSGRGFDDSSDELSDADGDEHHGPYQLAEDDDGVAESSGGHEFPADAGTNY
jgi:hypothetical protein